MKTVNKFITIIVIIFSVVIVFLIGYFIFYYPNIIYYNPKMQNLENFKLLNCKNKICIEYKQDLKLKNSSITLKQENQGWTLKDDSGNHYIVEKNKIKITSKKPANSCIKNYFYFNYITKKLSNFK